MVASARLCPIQGPEQRGREALRESGERKRPSLDVLTRLAKALKVTAWELVEQEHDTLSAKRGRTWSRMSG
jgi:transcriptional regulator with XRE-family HTH domain